MRSGQVAWRATLALALGWCVAARAETLAVNIGIAGPNQKDAFTQLTEDFRKAHPGVEVKLSFVDLEGYKTQLPNWLQAEAPDVVNWYAGERMRYYAKRKLLEDLTDLWKKNGWEDAYASTVKTSSYEGKRFALPYMYYSWGVFYRTDLFEKVGAKVPGTWQELLDACQKLKAAGIAPITTGGKDAWNLAGWFDYLNLRTNGYDFHVALTEGTVAYTDPKVRKALAHWKTLLDGPYFIENVTSYDYNTAQPFLYQGKAAMFLMGTFMAGNFPAEVKDKIGYFKFPTLDPAVKPAEDGPTDTLHIPVKARNKAAARKFLEFAAQPENAARLAKAMGSLPANRNAKVEGGPLEQTGFQILSDATGGVAQFYDRDTTKEMADEGMKGMQEFISNPGRIDAILERLEKARKRIYKQ
jgi:multiple sugar transport system substrate-binding protein